MRPLGETRRHFWLVQRMADVSGLDLARASARGDLDQETWADVVQRCRGCVWTEGCERFLQRGHEDGFEWPEKCLNRLSLATLKAFEEMDNDHEIQ